MLTSVTAIAKWFVLLIGFFPLIFGQPVRQQGNRSLGISESNQKTGKLYPRSHLLVVGIDEYPKSPNFHKLKWAVSDANAVADVLIKSYGFTEMLTTRLLTKEATQKAILDALAHFADEDEVGPDDRVVVFFACHGSSLKGDRGDTGFLVPYDADVDSAKPNAAMYLRSCVTMDDVWQALDHCKAKHILVMADACFGGLLAGRSGPMPKETAASYLGRKARVIITAGSSDEEVYENKRLQHGVFTACLLDAFRDLSSRKDGFTTTELFGEINFPVHTQSEQKQTPVLDYHINRGEVLFFPTEAIPTPPSSGVKGPKPTETPRSEPKPHGKLRTLRAGIEVTFVPAGPFTMGVDDSGIKAFGPERSVTLDDYWIGVNDVTVSQFKEYDADPQGYRKDFGRHFDWKSYVPAWGWSDESLPMVVVTWEEARAFCKWAGGDLPTEAQWEKAARGNKGNVYPWGNEWDPSKVVASKSTWGDRKSPMPVGSIPEGASPYGCLDMEGNVQQWCLDWFDPEGYAGQSEKNPSNPESKSPTAERVARGCPFAEIDAGTFLTYGRPHWPPGFRTGSLGFRVAIPPGSEEVSRAKPEVKPTNKKLKLKAGIEMTRVPAGKFTMGVDGDSSATCMGPERQVDLDEYWIGVNTVTVRQFREYASDPAGYRKDFNGKTFPWKERVPDWGWQNEDLPMVMVDWNEARAFCKWAGGDLPTDAQWEKAARGLDGREFPWGGVWDSSKVVASAESIGDRKAPMPVGSIPGNASPFGCLDMEGNVWQWCLDWFDPKGYASLPLRNPCNIVPDASRKEHSVRGGHFRAVGASGAEFRAFWRGGYPTNTALVTIGFRVAASGDH